MVFQWCCMTLDQCAISSHANGRKNGAPMVLHYFTSMCDHFTCQWNKNGISIALHDFRPIHDHFFMSMEEKNGFPIMV